MAKKKRKNSTYMIADDRKPEGSSTYLRATPAIRKRWKEIEEAEKKKAKSK